MPPDTVRADINNMSPNPEGGDINNTMEFLGNTVGAFAFIHTIAAHSFSLKKIKWYEKQNTTCN